MGIKNRYQQTVVLGEQFLKDTGNVYRVVSKRPYTDKKGILPNGVILTLQITKDHAVYEDSEDNMILETFDATVLTGSHDVGLIKGDFCELEDFKKEVSFYFNFTYLLRFGGVKKLVIQEGGANNATRKAT